MSSKYEMRVSPDGEIVAIRSRGNEGRSWSASGGYIYTDDEVADWPPLVPQPPRWKSEKLALDEYSMLWEHGKNRKGDHMDALKHVVGVLLYGDPIAPDPEPELRQWGVRGPNIVTVPIHSINVLNATLKQLPKSCYPVTRTRTNDDPTWFDWRELTAAEATEAGIAR
jgi:hypothetical protein